jgi:hypothetical protein
VVNFLKREGNSHVQPGKSDAKMTAKGNKQQIYMLTDNLNKRAMMALKTLTCIKAPGAGPILTQGLLFEQTW